MSEERVYRMIATITDGKETKEIVKSDIWFSTSAEGYGNRTYMRIDDDRYYDIRYDESYSPDNEIGYLVNWACTNWSGKCGSWKLTGIEVKAND